MSAVIAALDGARQAGRREIGPNRRDATNSRVIFPSSNELGIPDLPRSSAVPEQLVCYGQHRDPAAYPEGSALHFFLDDYRFESVWHAPGNLLPAIDQGLGLLTPDFSLWPHMPPAVQLWQVYRNRWIGAAAALLGAEVTPTAGWSLPWSYEFCFLGIPRGSHVAVSTVGVAEDDARALYQQGFEAMLEAIAPELVLWYGRLEGFDTYGAAIKHYPSRWEARRAILRRGAGPHEEAE